MAITNYTQTQWARLCEGATKQMRDRLGGPSPGGAAVELNITRQAVSNAIRRDSLHLINIFDRYGQLVSAMVTEESIKWYKLKQRARTQKQPQLQF